MTSGRMRTAVVSAVVLAAITAAAAPAHAAEESPRVPSTGSSVIGPQEIFDWVVAFVLSALGVV